MNLKVPAIIFVVVLALSGLACNKRDVSEFTDTPIIESYLHPGDFFNVQVSRQTPFSSNVTYSSDDINHLDIQVTSGNGTIYTLQPAGDGKYVDSSLKVAEGDN